MTSSLVLIIPLLHTQWHIKIIEKIFLGELTLTSQNKFEIYSLVLVINGYLKLL